MTTYDPSAVENAALSEPQSEDFRFYKVRLSAQDAWFGAIIAVLFNALGMLLEIEIIRKTPGVPVNPAILSFIVALALLAALLRWRKTPSVRWANIIYVINTAAVLTVLLATNTGFASLDPHWSPFQASKLGCLIAAMVAPGFGVGLLSILAYCVSAFVQFQFFIPPEVKTSMDTAEPWPIFAFGLAGVLALVYRFRRAQLEQKFARVQAQNFAIKQLASAFLNIRDLMNTPLQVIELSTRILRDPSASQKSVIDNIDRSVQSLREINSVLVQHEKEIEWRTNR